VTGRATVALAALVVLGGAALYVVILSQWPQGGPVRWSGGSPLAKGLLLAAGASGVLALVVAIQAVTRWRARRDCVLGRLHRTAVASAILAGAWTLLDLVGWL
jgi:hypothetical protein